MSTESGSSTASRIDFRTAEDDHTSSWQRALEDDAEITEVKPGRFAVQFDDSESGHVVHLTGDGSSYGGNCSCPGWKFHTGPCAHLCAVYQRIVEGTVIVPEVDVE